MDTNRKSLWKRLFYRAESGKKAGRDGSDLMAFPSVPSGSSEKSSAREQKKPVKKPDYLNLNNNPVNYSAAPSVPVSSFQRDMTRLMFSASSVWNRAAEEYCLTSGRTMNSLDETDNMKISEYACTPISYFFLWAARRGFLSERLTNSVNIASMLIERANPADFIRKYLNSAVSADDFSAEIQGFINEYYNPQTCFTGDQGRKFENDYYVLIRNPWKVFFCIDFSKDIYDRLEEKIDEAYEYFISYGEWINSGLSSTMSSEEIKHSETFNQYLTVRKARGLYRSYVDRCLSQVDNMPVGMTDRLCDKLIDFAYRCGNKIEKYRMDTESILSELHSGRIIIPVPHSDEIAYVLAFDADFEKEQGIGVVIRGGDIIDVTYLSRVQSPWMCENDLRYKIVQSLKLTDVSAVDSLGKALREYSDGSLEQGVVVPEYTGADVPDENRLFVPQPVSELKARNDIIAEKMMHEGLADRYECVPVYNEGSFVPSYLKVSLYLRDRKVFNSEVSIW